MTGLWSEYDMYDVTTTRKWHCHEMTITWVWHYGHALLMPWSWYDHRVIMPLLMLGCARIMWWSCYHRDMVVHWSLVIIFVINGHLWSFMSISLPCLCYLKVVPRSLFKVITGSWLIIPRQSQLETWSRHAHGSDFMTRSWSCYCHSIVISWSCHGHGIVMPYGPKSYHGHIMIQS